MIWTLAIALTIAGLPLAHAQSCATLQVAAAADDMMDHATAMHHAPAHQQDDSPASSPCKCLNCSSLCAAFVAPLPQLIKIERRVAAIVYAISASPQQDAAIVIDPGIPIAA